MAAIKMNQKIWHGKDTKEKPNRSVKRSLDRDFVPVSLSHDNYIKNDKYTDKHEFVSRIYELTGFKCEI